MASGSSSVLGSVVLAFIRMRLVDAEFEVIRATHWARSRFHWLLAKFVKQLSRKVRKRPHSASAMA
jgi:hypothetical protein